MEEPAVPAAGLSSALDGALCLRGAETLMGFPLTSSGSPMVQRYSRYVQSRGISCPLTGTCGASALVCAK
eukprot:CAMPEP_0174941664 /NCGR_PEP_ID=MMETSP1355-20121228/72370_1 /TAXON_ID=464990 /ORGANISM="Hemiselmis tepida, Strain CCMP443" /LENGTH=69 /DNA_ID=CAMNT_0016188785 /DNA_START=3 /DNA_END=212 /DNA_ORIENTATION=+